MLAGFQILPTPAGVALAALAVVLGAPVFAEGLRVARLIGSLRRLAKHSLGEAPGGLAHVAGRVTLESPLFSPLSGNACAAYRLEVTGQNGAVSCSTSELRPFRILDGNVVGRVRPDRGELDIAVTGTRDVRAEEQLSENLASILGRMPEAQWLRRTGGTLRITEYALVAGSFCHVVGHVRRGREAVLREEELAATGTDGATVSSVTSVSAEPEVWIDDGDSARFLIVADHAPEDRQLQVPRWRALGLVAGPVCTLFGLIYLANLADHLRAAGRL
jgi:hypothetical protein